MIFTSWSILQGKIILARISPKETIFFSDFL